MPFPAPDAVAKSPIQPIDHFSGARDAAGPAERLRRVVERARALRADLLAQPPVPHYRSMELIRVPYPTRYALRDACRVPTPLVHIVNRMFVVQFRADGALKTLLVSPSDHEANAATPFFTRLREGLPRPLRSQLDQLIAPAAGSVAERLAEAGLRPEEIDYITFDHLHTQDLRRWLGSAERPGFFPNAQLLVMRQEWASALSLLPPQADWYAPGGLEGVPPERVVQLDGDVLLGESVALVRTPGHTEGNHSIAVRTEEGIFVTSENGVCCDAYAPRRSTIPGVASYAARTGMEVVLNGNTLERGLDQYISMIQERELAGPSARDERFYGTVCSSELAPYWLFPGIAPTFAYGDIQLGAAERRAAA